MSIESQISWTFADPETRKETENQIPWGRLPRMKTSVSITDFEFVCWTLCSQVFGIRFPLWQTGLSAFSKNFASVAAQGEAKELSHLRKAFEEEQFEDICNYLDSLSEKEKLLLKMEQVSELKKKGYFCQNCREFFLYKPKTCVDRDHSIESRAVVVRWFQCVPCKRVACVYSKFPKRACRGCGSDQVCALQWPEFLSSFE